jgi:hypothetical protein
MHRRTTRLESFRLSRFLRASVRGRWSVKKNTGHAGSGRCGGGCPSGGRAASVPRGVGPPAKRTSRGDGCVSYGGALSHAGGSLATRRGGGVSSFGTAHGGAGGARKCGRTMKSQGGLGRLARGEARRCSRSKACCTNDGRPTGVGRVTRWPDVPGGARVGPDTLASDDRDVAVLPHERGIDSLDASRDRSATLAA